VFFAGVPALDVAPVARAFEIAGARIAFAAAHPLCVRRIETVARAYHATELVVGAAVERRLELRLAPPGAVGAQGSLEPDEGGGAALLTFSALPNSAPGFELGRLIRRGIEWALRSTGGYSLHAAAVADPRSGVGALLCGPTGSGKSTLTLQFTAAGWHYASDDVVVLRQQYRDVDAAALRRRVGIKEGPRLRGVSALQPALSSEVGIPGKHWFDPAPAYPGQFAPTVRPGLLLFPSVCHRPRTTFEPLTSIQAFDLLLAESGWRADAEAARHLETLVRLAEQAPAFTMHCGLDVLDSPEDVTAEIARLFPQESHERSPNI
jgi:hypothetical protein